jgi:hypothetical protein
MCDEHELNKRKLFQYLFLKIQAADYVNIVLLEI